MFEMNYKSSISLLGLPLVHLAIGLPKGSPGIRGIAKGWIAVGDIAFGVVFALGGLAVGGFSVGGLSVGVLAFAGLSIGIWAFGGLSIGVFAIGGASIAVWAAHGGMAVSSEHALGGLAIGSNANTDAARAYFESSFFFRIAVVVARHSRWLLALAVIIPIITMLIKLRRKRAT
jgi:hypothetical protein